MPSYELRGEWDHEGTVVKQKRKSDSLSDLQDLGSSWARSGASSIVIAQDGNVVKRYESKPKEGE